MYYACYKTFIIFNYKYFLFLRHKYFSMKYNDYSPDESEEAVLYQKLKAQYMTHTQDFLTMSRIASLISSLAESFAVRRRRFVKLMTG